MKIRPKAALTTALAVAAMSTLAACGGSSADEESADAGGEYVWGFNGELTGAAAYYAETFQTGVKAYVEQVNADGGINGHKIKLVSLDNAADSARAATNTTRLATSDHVNAVFGYVFSANCSAAQVPAERYTVPLACLSVAEQSNWTFSAGASNPRGVTASLESAKAVTGKDNPKVAVASVNTLTSKAWADGVVKDSAAAGVDVIVSVEQDFASTDPSAQSAKIVAAKPDAVLITHSTPGLLATLKAVRAAGIDAPFIWVDGSGGLPQLAETKDPALYAMSVFEAVTENPEGAGAQKFLEALTPLIDDPGPTAANSGQAALGYMTATAYGSALESCGFPCSGKDLQAELLKTKIDIEGMVENFGYAKGDHYPYSHWYTYKVDGPKIEQIGKFDAN